MTFYKTNSKGKIRLGVLTAMLIACIGLLTASLYAQHKPSRTTTSGGKDMFRNASPFAQNFVIDQPVYWIPIVDVPITVSVASDVTGTFTATVASIATGNAVPTEVNTSGLSGLLLNANDESFVVMIPAPIDCDYAGGTVSVRHLWSNSESAATGTLTMTYYYGLLTAGTSTVGSGEVSGAFSTAGGAQADKAAHVVQWGPWSTIAAGTIAPVTPDSLLVLKGKATLGTIADASVYGVQIKCDRKWLGGN